jgi:hypothetical protein
MGLGRPTGFGQPPTMELPPHRAASIARYERRREIIHISEVQEEGRRDNVH